MSARSKLAQILTFGGAGAALAYFFDPDRGRARRTQTRDQLISRARSMTEDVEKQARYVEGQLQGVRARADGKGKMDPQDDHLIKQGIEQRLAAAGLDTTDVVIDVTDGVVGLRGQVPSADQLDKVQNETTSVPGVEEIHSWLHLPSAPAPNKATSLKGH